MDCHPQSAPTRVSHRLTGSRSHKAGHLPDGKGNALLPGKNEDLLFPVVVMTSYGDEKAAVEAMKAGALDYIAKSETMLRDMPHLVTQALREWHHITKRRKAEASLAEEKERLVVALRSIGDAVITTDIKGRISLMNKVAERLTGWLQEDALGEPLERVFRIVNEHTRESCDNPVEKVFETGGVVGLANDTVLIGKKGTERVIEDSRAPILDQQNRTIGVVLVFRDATEKRRLQEEQQKAQKLESIGVLACGIAHDFNNFLTGIIGNLSLAKLDVQPGDPVSWALDEMEKAAVRAKDLTQQLLTFSTGGEPVRHATNIGDLARESAQFALRGSNVRCRFSIDDALLPADVDDGQIAQVVHNLIINADQAMPNGGTVLIQGTNVTLPPENPFALEPGDHIQLSIHDEGIGIHPKHQKKNIRPILHHQAKRQRAGTGCGLQHHRQTRRAIDRGFKIRPRHHLYHAAARL